MSPYELIRLIGASMQDGTSERSTCPWCHGGRTREESFIVTRAQGSLKYTCFRASCMGRSSGVLSISGAPEFMYPVKKKERVHELTAETQRVSEESLGILSRRFQFTRELVDYYRFSETNEGDIVIPIYNSRGIVQGHERKIKVPFRTKTVRYNGTNSDGMGWYNLTPKYTLPATFVSCDDVDQSFISDAIVLVEDLYSAVKANYFIHSLSLMGTNLSPEQAGILAAQKYRAIFLALDADASAKAVHLANRHRATLPNLRVVLLKKDIKDSTYNEVCTLIHNNYKRL